MGDRGFQGKWSHYDQSLHVPLIVYDPRLKSELRGRVLQETALNLDIPATILDLAAIPVPAKYQGASLTPLLAGAPPKNWRTDFYVEHHANPAQIATWFGVRDSRYTYANYYQNGAELLYDRERDPTELTNVATDPAYAATLAQLRQRGLDYKTQYTRSGAPPASDAAPAGTKKKTKPTAGKS
jgi:arylsulfatase A-like enzyme